MIFGGELGCNLSGTTLQFLLRSELRSGNLIILSVVLSLLLILNLLGGENLTLGIMWWFTTIFEGDLALDLVHLVEGLHYVLRKRVGLGLVMVPLEWNIVLLLRPKGVPQRVGYDQHPFFLWLGEVFHHLHHKYHFAPPGSRYSHQTPRYTSPQ